MAKFGKMKTLIQLIVGVGILLWMLRLADLRNVLTIITQISPINLIISITFFIIASTFVALALYAPLKRSIPKPSLRRVIMASFAGQLLSDVTPVRSGYFLTPIFLNELADVPVEQGMMGVLTTGSINSFVKVSVCLIGLGYFTSFLSVSGEIVNALIIGVFVLLIGGVILFMFMWEKRFSKLVIKSEKLPLIGKSLRGFVRMFNGVQENGRKAKRSIITVALFIAASLLCNAAALYFVFNGLLPNFSLGLIDFFFIASAASTLTYVPITIAGLGVQEAGYVIMISLLLRIPINPSYVKPEIMAFALLTRILFTGTDIIGIVPLLKAGFKKSKKS